MIVTDEMVEAAYVAFKKFERNLVPGEFYRIDSMRAALEAGAAPCIEDLAAALRKIESINQEYEFPKVTLNVVTGIARTTLARWGLEK